MISKIKVIIFILLITNLIISSESLSIKSNVKKERGTKIAKIFGNYFRGFSKNSNKYNEEVVANLFDLILQVGMEEIKIQKKIAKSYIDAPSVRYGKR
jgi:hypothetical protein